MRELAQIFPTELVVVGVHAAKFPNERVGANLRAAVQRLDVDHPVVEDADLHLWRHYAVRARPTLMIVDPRGYVVAKHEGEFPLAPVRDCLAAARFWEPSGLARSAHRLYVADTNNHAIRVLDPAAGKVTTLDLRD